MYFSVGNWGNSGGPLHGLVMGLFTKDKAWAREELAGSRRNVRFRTPFRTPFSTQNPGFRTLFWAISRCSLVRTRDPQNLAQNPTRDPGPRIWPAPGSDPQIQESSRTLEFSNPLPGNSLENLPGKYSCHPISTDRRKFILRSLHKIPTPHSVDLWIGYSSEHPNPQSRISHLHPKKITPKSFWSFLPQFFRPGRNSGTFPSFLVREGVQTNDTYPIQILILSNPFDTVPRWMH